MSRIIDFNKPLSDEDKLWLHQWGYDYKIVENEQRFAQANVHDAGKPIDVAKVLADAGLQKPSAPTSPVLFDNATPSGGETQSAAKSFDEEALRAEIADFTVAELRENIQELGGHPDGNKSALQDQLIELLRSVG